MEARKLRLLKKSDKGEAYQADSFRIVYRHKGTVSGDNQENKKELIYLVSGTVKVTIKDQSQNIEAPASIVIPAKTYHKILALTDIAFVLIET